MPLRLAMWSGPRNISTAMMRSWGNRSDTVVCDEPLYAYYLHATGKPHPGAEEVIRTGQTDWRKVVAELTGQSGLLAPRVAGAAAQRSSYDRLLAERVAHIADGPAIYYQKQMTHHLLPEINRDWLGQVTSAFLIRHPREMLTSYIKIVERPTLLDTGFPQQTEIFERVREHLGVVPPVVDTKDVLENPRRMLALLCEALGVEFQEAMLAWPPGPRPTDGVWAKHWYSAVERSTGFQPYQPKDEPVPEDLEDLCEQCLAHYERLHAHRLR